MTPTPSKAGLSNWSLTKKIVEVVEFESGDPAFAGEMRITVSFVDTDGGTEVTLLFEDIPKGISPEDNERGAKSSLEKLAALLEAGRPTFKMPSPPSNSR
jgi:Activator of Hsp90 ATPase homolog 1-like protein